MVKYLTNQRKTLLSYLSEHPDEQISAKQIASELESSGISLSAVYRNLSDLEAEEKVKRCQKAGTREVLYQYIAAESCAGCLHLSCSRCGKTIHMHTAQADALVKQVEEKEAFLIDKGNTVLCQSCQKK